ncbi:MAG: LPS export ABC transporter permease LptG [Gammaproteobacteria bacterium]|nr:LPS export ABC transporter permease LptG [Gammaproteobacteria bacterium]
MPILERYLGGIIAQYTLVALLGLLGLFVFANFLDQLSDLGRGRYGVLDALWYIALTAPRTAYELLPMATLLGAIIGLSLLAGDSELIVLRASGVSLPQITVAALKTAGLFVIAAVLIGELIAPQSEIRAQRGRAEALQRDIKQHTHFGLWMRDAGTYVNIGEVLPDLTVRRVKLFQFSPDRKLRALVFAEHGEFAGDHWALSEVRETRFTPGGGVETAHRDTRPWRTSVTPQILSVFLLRPGQLSMWQLRRYIRHLADNRQQTRPYELAFWNKLMLPLTVAVMVALAVPFVFANLRSGTLGRSVFAGILLGLGFYAASRGFGYIVLAYGLPPLLGATLPLVAFLLLALVMMRRIN